MEDYDFLEALAKRRAYYLEAYGEDWERLTLRVLGWNDKEIALIIHHEKEILKNGKVEA